MINCKWGLHGAIEVMSRKAVEIYVDGAERCEELLEHEWGEDQYLDSCMNKLGVVSVNEFGLLTETECGEAVDPCKGTDVVFHPFKTVDRYFKCWEFASMYGEQFEELEHLVTDTDDGSPKKSGDRSSADAQAGVAKAAFKNAEKQALLAASTAA